MPDERPAGTRWAIPPARPPEGTGGRPPRLARREGTPPRTGDPALPRPPRERSAPARLGTPHVRPAGWAAHPDGPPRDARRPRSVRGRSARLRGHGPALGPVPRRRRDRGRRRTRRRGPSAGARPPGRGPGRPTRPAPPAALGARAGGARTTRPRRPEPSSIAGRCSSWPGDPGSAPARGCGPPPPAHPAGAHAWRAEPAPRPVPRGPRGSDAAAPEATPSRRAPTGTRRIP